jgi:hypothetical protein
MSKNFYLKLIIAGPVLVIVASIVTIYIAVKNPPILVIEKDTSRHTSEEPAMKARNK